VMQASDATPHSNNDNSWCHLKNDTIVWCLQSCQLCAVAHDFWCDPHNNILWTSQSVPITASFMCFKKMLSGVNKITRESPGWVFEF
jgi:hypothetical protein